MDGVALWGEWEKECKEGLSQQEAGDANGYAKTFPRTEYVVTSIVNHQYNNTYDLPLRR
jgi:hypothetical protein